MVDDGTYTAVLDRFESELAVLIVEADGEAVDDLVIPRDRLPRDGQAVDTVFEIEVVDGELSTAVVDTATTEERAERAQDRFDRLSQRPPSGDDEEGDPADN